MLYVIWNVAYIFSNKQINTYFYTIAYLLTRFLSFIHLLNRIRKSCFFFRKQTYFVNCIIVPIGSRSCCSTRINWDYRLFCISLIGWLACVCVCFVFRNLSIVFVYCKYFAAIFYWTCNKWTNGVRTVNYIANKCTCYVIMMMLFHNIFFLVFIERKGKSINVCATIIFLSMDRWRIIFVCSLLYVKSLMIYACRLITLSNYILSLILVLLWDLSWTTSNV